MAEPVEPPPNLPQNPPQNPLPSDEPPVQFQDIDLRQGADVYELQGVNPLDLTDPACTLARLVNNILGIVMVIAVLLLLLYLIWGAIDWITSGGDKGKTEKARDKMTGATIGILILSAVIVIFMAIQRFLGISVLSFNGSCAIGGTTAPTQSPAPINCAQYNGNSNACTTQTGGACEYNMMTDICYPSGGGSG